MSQQDDIQVTQLPELGKGGSKDSWDKLSERARKVIVLARQEAHNLGHDYIGSEHLLLGLVVEGDGIAARVLMGLGVDGDRVRKAIEHVIGRGQAPAMGEVALAPRARKVVELAVEEARQLGRQHIGVEHLLLGIVREGEGIAADILKSLGVALEQVRTQVLQAVAPPAAPKNNVVMCRLDDRSLQALDTLIETGVRTTRSDAAAWLIGSGIEANASLFETVSATVAEIRRLRGVAYNLAQQATGGTNVFAIMDSTTGDKTGENPA